MVRALLGSFLMVVVASTAWPATDPAVTALRQQVQALRSQEKAVVKAIQGQYNAVIKQGSVSQAQVKSMQAAIKQQQRDQLALATSSTDREAIRQRYAALKQALGGQGTLGKVQVAQLRKDKSALVKQVKALYSAKIKGLEADIRAQRAADKASGGRKK